MTISRSKILALCALALLTILFVQRGCNQFAWGFIDYERVQTIVDEKTGLHVALGRGRSFSSDGFVLHIKESSSGLPWPRSDDEVIYSVTNVRGDAALTRPAECYVLTVPYETLWIFNEKWKVGESGQELCFELKNESPK